jgi:predicted metalloprotease with PDZ domain
LLADLEIRERTQNRRSLDDALRAVLLGGGDVSVRWDLARALEMGDRATGIDVLTDLHRRMGNAPYPVDLTALWKRLGVKLVGDQLVFDDAAPLAGLRRSMTQPNRH